VGKPVPTSAFPMKEIYRKRPAVYAVVLRVCVPPPSPVNWDKQAVPATQREEQVRETTQEADRGSKEGNVGANNTAAKIGGPLQIYSLNAFFYPIRMANFERQPIAALHICTLCTGMLERGEIDVAVTDLSLTFPRAQVTSCFNYSLPVLIVLADFLKAL
jgi:hypothetical protein